MIYLISGKRASGKDTFCSFLSKNLKNTCVVALADAPKKAFCHNEHLNFDRFMKDRDYKELYRKQFIEFAENAKSNDKYVWCKTAMKNYNKYNNIIISDLRYEEELMYFKKFFTNNFCTIRIEASQETRKSRGWSFSTDIDEHPSETSMDNIVFDFVINNDVNDNGININKQLKDLEII